MREIEFENLSTEQLQMETARLENEYKKISIQLRQLPESPLYDTFLTHLSTVENALKRARAVLDNRLQGLESNITEPLYDIQNPIRRMLMRKGDSGTSFQIQSSFTPTYDDITLLSNFPILLNQIDEVLSSFLENKDIL